MIEAPPLLKRQVFRAVGILHAKGYGLGRVLEVALVFFAIPLTTVTILIGVYRYWRKLRVEATKTG